MTLTNYYDIEEIVDIDIVNVRGVEVHIYDDLYTWMVFEDEKGKEIASFEVVPYPFLIVLDGNTLYIFNEEISRRKLGILVKFYPRHVNIKAIYADYVNEEGVYIIENGEFKEVKPQVIEERIKELVERGR